ncbi:MAG: hypothetical protein NC211_02860 [Alistipes senegalensis]|nr:hypothetical protein [Oxalobacter formigenes]MCM1280762.1 hypothetical protein [Alistipes senegalensis]
MKQPMNFREFLSSRLHNRSFMKKVGVFLVTLVIGMVLTVRTAIKANFTADSIHEWVLNGLTVAAVLGFIAVKYLKSKGKLD